ncbi:MAG: glycoside hydrolase family 3 C-terminal domain-containing protein [Clostridiales bacterium]|nr:glycoside hydrolase family 3 C-terminal domain-containing protein [Clostridiales bacterium]
MATKLTDAASIEEIIKEMTVKEKAACITGGSSFCTRAMEKYGIPSLLLLDGGTGYNTNQYYLDLTYQEYAKRREEEGNPIDEETCIGRMGGLEIVLSDPDLWELRHKHAREAMGDNREYGCYPPGILFGATWNPEVIEACGHALGEETNARGVDVLLGTPNVNIHRDPRNGRLFEGYSEDPCLVSKLAPFFVKGVQDEGVLADVKHFAANNQETDRMGVNEHIPERALREIYLPGFQACVDAGCKTVMSAYNKINGVPCAQNRWLLHDVLRGEWGFDGFVMTDWSAAYDQVEACAAGNDLVMPGPRQMGTIIRAVEEGTLPEEALDECVRNFLRGVLESPTMKGRKTEFDIQEGIAAAYNAAKEGIVLLKNDGILPLSKDARPAFFGRRSREMLASGAGSAAVNTSLNTNVYDCVAEALGADQVSFGEIREDTTVVIVTVSANGQEGADRPDMLMEPEDRAVLDAAMAQAEAKEIPVIVLLNVAAPVQVVDWEQKTSAILCMFIPGMQGGAAAADILLGKVNPSGKLPLTFPKEYRDCPTYGNFPGYDSEVWYGEGIYVGYRYYEKKGVEVMYPFGYGLSYTTFAITGADVPSQVNVDEGDVTVAVKVKNTGAMAGSEVVQLYIHDVESTLEKPYKELKAFQKVYLEPGEEKEIHLVLTKKDFASYDCRLSKWAAEPGEFRLLIGNSSANITHSLTLNVVCENPYSIGPQTDIVKVVSNPRAQEIAEEVAGVKLHEVAGSYIVFQPLTTFSQIWKECVLPAIHVDEETSQSMLDKIYSAWSAL